jgi:hypothetical protein
MMHEDNVVADSVVYSCLVKAFSNKKEENLSLPAYTNGYSGSIDWNKMRLGDETQSRRKSSWSSTPNASAKKTALSAASADRRASSRTCARERAREASARWN